MSEKSALTEKQQAFVDAYRGEANGNPIEAARIAGYASPETQGYAVLQTNAVAAALNNHAAEQTAYATVVTGGEVPERPDLHSRVLRLEAVVQVYGDEITTLRERIDELEQLVGQP